ncbi:MAG: SCO family protein [Bacteroidales bacterium]|jgi:protein SCO1/2
MRKLLPLVFVLSSMCGFGQTEPPKPLTVEIGIVEQLGQTIPLDLNFLNETGDTVTLRQLIDKPTALSFVYYDCPSICGPFQSGIADVVSKVDATLGKDYQIILISFNPLDNPVKAREKKKNYVQKIPENQQSAWHYLTGWQENIKRITDAVGYHFKPTGLDFAHPSALIILSPQGKITRYLFGITFLPFDLKMALIEAQKGQARPTINKVLEYCFSYNDTSHSYTLQITRIVATLTILIALVVFLVLMIMKQKKTANRKPDE